MGYSEKINKPFEFGIIRNHYTGRTFIQESTSIRHLSVKLKHNPNLSSLKNKNIGLIDDSIVRGTTSIKIVEMLRNCGVKKIHMRIASPPVKFPCFYGIDTPTKKELLASRYSIQEIQKYIGVDSLNFISLDGVYKALVIKREEIKRSQNLQIITLVVTILLNWLIKNQDLFHHSFHF